jgi:hypothetical protein
MTVLQMEVGRGPPLRKTRQYKARDQIGSINCQNKGGLIGQALSGGNYSRSMRVALPDLRLASL